MSSALTPVHRGQRLATDGSVALNWMTSIWPATLIPIGLR